MERSLVENVFLFTLNVAGWLWGVMSFVPWYYMSGRSGQIRRQKIQARPTSLVPGAPYRDVEHFDALVTTLYKGITTMDQLFRRSVQLYAFRKCLGTRETLSIEEETQPNGRVFKKEIRGEYNWLTYAEVDSRARNLGNGLITLGQQPRQNIVVFAETQADWMVSALSCFGFGFPVVTIYATLGDEAVAHGINETEVNFVITDSVLLPKLAAVSGQLTQLQHIIYMGNAKKSVLMNFPSSIKLHSMVEVEELGSRQGNAQSRYVPHPEDTAVIMYTSGSTGLPKGVIISHANLLAATAAMGARVEPSITEKDVYVGYLPLAHVLELVAENALLAHGACIGYSSPLTLSDQSSKIKKGSKGDLTVLRPTLMAAVPVIMDRIRQNVMEKVKDGPRLLQLFFTFAYNYKLQQIKRGYDAPLLNRFIFAKLRKLLGGRVRQMLSGGAPLSSDTQYFMNVCFCCPVGQGYGLTETCGGGTICHTWDRTTGRVGPPIASCEVKLVSWEEGGYTIRDKPFARGEIVIGGSNVTLGYYKNPQKTQEDFEVDRNGQRWFHTGDIGEFHDDGCLKIIDRKKDLVKLQSGEYVSLGKVEAALAQCQYVENVCVFADSLKTFCVCLVVPRPKQLKQLADSLQVPTDDWSAVCSNKAIREAVLKDIRIVGNSAKLEKFEIPQRMSLVLEQWTPESELVTAALKLKRKNITSFYQDTLRTLYN
ncbi:predicted protein [Nematostella vectensis]|uniref:long-chain-fatty-acid--CoA ligase n=1 Tax=Nematostella vectensis TaxID=45351 RepID=A7T2D4_NEMVE|nr:predicted protein [Nematostella vectensis]|eukprot:XP_001621979.1 hypothetical protein NEMVEDRAFT_v1g195566 [Nematostella vectensis]